MEWYPPRPCMRFEILGKQGKQYKNTTWLEVELYMAQYFPEVLTDNEFGFVMIVSISVPRDISVSYFPDRTM